MRASALMSVIGALLISQPSLVVNSPAATGAASAPPALARTPSIKTIRMKGNKLIVTGEDFADDALIVVDSVEQRTISDSDFPGQRLIAPKAGKHIERDKVLTVGVKNSALHVSEPVYLLVTDSLWARVIRPNRFTPTPSPLYLARGTYLMLDLPQDGGPFSYIVTLSAEFFQRITDPPFDVDTRQLYRVEQKGTTWMRIEIRYGEPAPTILDFDVVVN